MLRWFLLCFALALAALGLFTVFKAPAWSSWKLALLAGEFGHWLAIVAVLIGIAAGWLAGDTPTIARVTLAIALGAALLLAKPAWQAWRQGPELAEQLAAQFGGAQPVPPPFSLATLFFGPAVTPVAVQSLTAPNALPLDFYRAVGRIDTPAPCVVMVHGGGWDSGDRTQLPGLNHWLARRGYAVAAISYRLAPRFQWPAQQHDLIAAIAWLKERAGELGIDPQRFVVIGRSAGGQIALVTAYTAGDPAIRGVIGLYAPSDLIFGYVNTVEDDMLKSPALMRQFLGGTPDSARANYESASALFHVTPRTPPTLLIHGVNDALVWYRHSVRLDARLAEQRIPRVYVSFPWATHAIEFNLNGPGGQLTTYAIEAFLAGVTK
ncbi:alpha/beta hydrolase fold domain-containing protein [Horticoccus sp. 23ND18S-11]|uniref:alpha/beta hydrolase fold domain-containing protein n=1 Tax=Horticoccus sp. 23ND18S-11 TaxID=3391832 RepID=UPI0039C8FCE1